MGVELSDFVGNPDIYAVQQDDGSYRPVREPVTVQVLGAHIRGEQTVGTYTNVFDKARFMVFDEDTGDKDMALALAAECQKRGMRAGLESSGRKGYHVWVLFREWHAAEDVRRVARNIAETVGFKGEVFPKQAISRDLGNLVKLPLGKHRATGARSQFLGGFPHLTGTQTLIDAVKALPPEATSGRVQTVGSSQFPCLESIQLDPPHEGQRNVLLFHFAAHMRRAGLLDDATRAAMDSVLNEDELDPGEFESILENSEFSGPICDQLPADRRCPDDLCVKTRRNYKGPRPGSLRNAAKGDHVMVTVGDADPTSRTVTLDHPDITMSRAGLKERD